VNWIGAIELGEERPTPDLATVVADIAREECRNLYERRLAGLEEELAAVYKAFEEYRHTM
jgi:hypothetical protein